jgi:hypothetical protein
MSRTRPCAVIAAFVMLAAPGTQLAQAAEPPAAQSAGLPALIRSARSGPWSAPSTWEGGRLPSPGSRVQIRTGHTVRYDLNADQAIRSLHLAGTLAFARDRDTRLDVGLLKIQPGEDASENGFDCDAHLPVFTAGQPRPTLEVGTAQQPIGAGHTARIRLVYFEGMDKQSCPALVCCGGQMELHGAPMSRTWVKLGATAKAGDSRVTLAEPVTGWRVGDHIILTATQREYRSRQTTGSLRRGAHEPPALREPPIVEGRDVPKAAFLRQLASAGDLSLEKRAALKIALAKQAAGGDCRPANAKQLAGGDCRPSDAKQLVGGDCRPSDAKQLAGKDCRPSDAKLAAEGECKPSTALKSGNVGFKLLKASGAAPDLDPEDGQQPVQPFTEERIVTGIDGATLTLDRPLLYPHRGTGEYRGEVADLSRNVIVESADPAGERGHTMYHRGSAGSISYAEFRHLGKEGVLGRYSLHFHLVGDTMRGSSVVGASIWDSGNRWLTIHGTNYLVVRDCVGYQSVGHGFYLEDGTETYNVLDRNLAVQAYRGRRLPKQNLPFDRNNGAGFWWANSLNSFTRNVACECEQYGYRFEATPSAGFDLHMPVQQPDGSRKAVDIRTLPFVRFEDNEAHSEIWGLNLGEDVDGVGPDIRHPFVVRNLKVWNTHWAFQPDSPSLMVDGFDVFDSRYGLFEPIYDHHAYRQLTFNETERPEANTTGPRPEGLAFGEDNSLPAGLQRAKAAFAKQFSAAAQKPGGIELPQGQADKIRAILTDPRSSKGGAPPEVDADKLLRSVRITPEPPPERRLADTGGPPLGPLSSAAFPRPLDPVDDLPPATVITFVGQPDHGKLLVRGTASDNGTVTRVLVNGREARALAPNFAEWEITLDRVRPGDLKLTAHAEDAAGNIERLPHELSLSVSR